MAAEEETKGNEKEKEESNIRQAIEDLARDEFQISEDKVRDNEYLRLGQREQAGPLTTADIQSTAEVENVEEDFDWFQKEVHTETTSICLVNKQRKTI